MEPGVRGVKTGTWDGGRARAGPLGTRGPGAASPTWGLCCQGQRLRRGRARRAAPRASRAVPTAAFTSSAPRPLGPGPGAAGGRQAILLGDSPPFSRDKTAFGKMCPSEVYSLPFPEPAGRACSQDGGPKLHHEGPRARAPQPGSERPLDLPLPQIFHRNLLFFPLFFKGKASGRF